jgi:hypothetical protein
MGRKNLRVRRRLHIYTKPLLIEKLHFLLRNCPDIHAAS